MVHETRHHDYDHDVDIDASPSSSPKPLLKREDVKSSPKAKRPAKAKSTAKASKIHRALQFPLLIIGNWLLSAGLYSAFMPFTAGDLATVSRSPDGGWLEIGALVAFRTFELAVGWWGEYDGYDLGALTLLTHSPYLFLLGAFYSIKPSTLVASLVIDITSTVVPVQLLRPLSAAHDPQHATAGTLANRRIVTDLSVQLYTSALASAVYALVLTLSFLLGLPTLFVSRFDYISDLTLAHSPTALPLLFLAFAPLGLAARVFVFTPSTAATRDGRDAANARFDPQTASLAETLVWNVWGYDRRTRVAIVRTGFLAMLTAATTFLQVVAHIAGTEPVGAATYSAVWSVASAAAGATLWWTTNVSEVKAE